MGKEQKKGAKGIAASYMTRNRAVRKLQISLKDFRRLCILKGIYPRDPKKKNNGKDKTYYHIKDIKFLSHEPLLQKFRELKHFLRKRKKAQVKKDLGRMARLEKHKPKMTLDHLVKERYPSFVDALRDLDDPLCMVHLFSALPAKLTKDHKPEMVALCSRLTQEFESYVFHTKCLRKVFVSIKGMYYQAQVQGQLITWLVPHKFNQVIPKEVDIRVMLTFLDFYLTLVKFSAFKLYHDAGLQYPPKIDKLAAARRAGLSALKLEALGDAAPKAVKSSVPAIDATQSQEQKEMQAVVKDVLSKMEDAPESTPEEDEETKATEEQKLDDFSQLDDSNLSPEELEKRQYSRLFAGLTFVLSREVPQDSLEFVILCGSGRVLREDQLTEAEFRNEIITHQVMDRPSLKAKLFSRQYIQPQWIYDSFNAKCLLPIEPYSPGKTPPPHLSPFVNDEAEGYVPAQRKVLEQWGMEAKGIKPAEEEVEEDEDEDDEEQDPEEAYEADLAKERAGIMFSETQGDAGGEGDEEEDEGDLVEDSDDEGDEGESEDEGDEEEESEEEEEAAPAKGKKRGREQEEETLSKIMMGRKDARLYSKMQHGIQKKADAVALLESKRRKLEQKQAGKKKKKKAAK